MVNANRRSRPGPGLENTIYGPGSVNEFFSVRAGKHKLGARVGKSKFGQGPVNTNLRPELVNAN